MAKEEDEDLSFRSVLYSVINGLEPPQVLLEHPEFQRRANRFCKSINPDGRSEDLVRQVCFHILQGGHLKPADLQDEDQFFRWFFVVARSHLKARSRDCIEPSKHWPDTADDLPSGEHEQFFAHADVCAYHRRILLMEETAVDEQFDSLVQTARGLDPHRIIHSVAHLNAATDDAKERLHVWNEAALTRGFLFEYIGFYNADKKVATISRFSDLRIHVSTHELVSRAGLQVRGMTSKYSNYEVLLGAFALIGVEDEIEQYLPLANGFTVGLSKKQLTNTKFTLRFRCVRTEIINKEKAGLNEASKEENATVKGSDFDLERSTRGRSMPAHIAASLLKTGARNVGHWVLCLILVLLVPVIQPMKSGEAVDPIPSSKSDGHASTNHGEQSAHDSKENLRTAWTDKLIHRTKPSVSDISAAYVKALHEELRPRIIPPTHASFTADGRLEMASTSTRVENVTVWQVRIYKTKPRQELLVTHFVDNKKMKDQIEQLLPEPSMTSIVLTSTNYWDLPQTGYEVKWKTTYAHEQLVSVEATIDRLGEVKSSSTSIVKEACAIAGCEDWLLSANAIANVYGYINPVWKPSIVFAIKNISQCMLGAAPQSSVFLNNFYETGVSGSTFDEIPNCSQSPASPPTN